MRDNKHMRIAMISVHTCPLAVLGGKESGGMNVYVRELTRELGRQGIGVDVFTRSQDEHQSHIKHDLENGNRVFHIPAGPERPIPKTDLYEWLPEFTGGVKLASVLLDEQYDLVHSHYWLSGVAAHELQKWWDVPIVHMAHTLGINKNKVAKDDQQLEPKLRLDTELRLPGLVDRIIVATDGERSQIEEMSQEYRGKTSVIPPGVDLTVFHPYVQSEARQQLEIPLDNSMVLFVGRIEPLKGVDTLLHAMQYLKDSGEMPSEMYMSVIGGDPAKPRETRHAELEKLMALRDELGLSDLVTFLGRRDQETLHRYYAAADVVVMPSHYESFGMVALEAMACGTPVIATDVGGLSQLVRDGETGFLVPGMDAVALAERLGQVLSDKELREHLGGKAAEYAEAYAWPGIAEQIIDLYKYTLNGHEV